MEDKEKLRLIQSLCPCIRVKRYFHFHGLRAHITQKIPFETRN